MSINPISPEQFSLAIADLPLDTLYSKAQEINNSINHLVTSNKALQEYSDSITSDQSLDGRTRQEVGDKECLDAIRENMVVIERQRERVRLIKGEVERRGQRWHEADPELEADGEREGEGSGQGVGRVMIVGNGVAADSVAAPDNGQQASEQNQNQSASDQHDDDERSSQSQPQSTTTQTQTQTQASTQPQPHVSGRLTDEQLQRQIEQLYGRDGDEEDDGGMHL